MKVYNSFEQIDQDLKKLNLERQIAVEELKMTQNQIKSELSLVNWLDAILMSVIKYGGTFVIKRFVKNR
jgi:hypothetical protein